MAMQTPTKVQVTTDALDVKSIRSILVGSEWHQIRDPALVQFAIGEAHSPVNPQKLFPTLRYSEGGRTCYTPLSKIQSFSQD